MNHSDQFNPRRLIRAIEIAVQKGPTFLKKSFGLRKCDFLWIGLTADKKILGKRIAKRVKDRVKAGAIQEWEKLKQKYTGPLPSMSGIGYKELPDINAWIKAEQQYCRRQLTWFNKNKLIHWFDITQKPLYSSVVNLVSSWYTK